MISRFVLNLHEFADKQRFDSGLPDRCPHPLGPLENGMHATSPAENSNAYEGGTQFTTQLTSYSSYVSYVACDSGVDRTTSLEDSMSESIFSTHVSSSTTVSGTSSCSRYSIGLEEEESRRFDEETGRQSKENDDIQDNPVAADGVEEDTENVGDVEMDRRLSNGHVAWWSRWTYGLKFLTTTSLYT